MLLMTIDKIPCGSTKLATLLCCSKPALSFLVTVIDTPHDTLDIELFELMQAADKITKKTMQQAVKQTLLKRIHPGSIMKGSSSSYVRLVVIKLLLKENKSLIGSLSNVM